jgi:hypothetical protein
MDALENRITHLFLPGINLMTPRCHDLVTVMGNCGVAAEGRGNKSTYGSYKTEEYTRYQTLIALLYWKHILCI